MLKNKKRIIYVFLLLIIAGVTILSSYSFAYMKNQIDTGKRIDFVAGTLDYILTSNDLNNNQITIDANSFKRIAIDIKSINKIDSKYQLFYKYITNLNSEEQSNFHIGYSVISKNTAYEEIKSNNTKQVIVSIANNNNKSVTIEFGTEGGLIYNEIELSNSELEINEMTNANMLTYDNSKTNINCDTVQCAIDGLKEIWEEQKND